MEFCAFCKSESNLKSCSGCGKTFYCSVEHQKSDWKLHKKNCRPFKIATDNVVGRCLQSTKDIKSGSIIFSEHPLVVGPDWSFRYVNCVGCFAPIGDSFSRCPKCQWPCCQPDCVGLENSKLHAIECLPLKGGSEVERDRNFYRTDVLFPLKCLMQQMRSPQKFEALMSLEKNVEARKASDNFAETEMQIDFLEQNYLKSLKIVEEKLGKVVLQKSDRRTLQEIFGIIETNALYLTDDNQVAGLYAIACLMEHSCIPNCHFQFDARNGFKLTVRAAKDIRKGEHLVGCYSNVLWGTQQRRQHLKEMKYFDCCCQRCSDPTELNSHFSSLRCIGLDGESCDGIQVPVNPTSDSGEWACNKCSARVSGDQVAFLVGKMNEEIEDITVKMSTAEEVESLMSKFSTFLHPQHYHMFALKHLSIKMLAEEKNSEETLSRKLKKCDDLLETMKLLDPSNVRLSIYKADVLFEKFSCIEEIQRRQLTERLPCSREIAIGCLKIAAEVLKHELDSAQGKKMNSKISEALTKFEASN